MSLETERLVLRRWRDSDREPFARLNADPQVMEFFPRCLTAQESGQMVDRCELHFDQHGFGLYAAELRETSACIGFIGLAVPAFDAHFTPAVEIGWRLAREYWNRGLATEGARAVAHHVFAELKLPALVSFTAERNLPSRRVMEKIGMSRDPAEDFDHPLLAPEDTLRRHVLYRLARPESKFIL